MAPLGRSPKQFSLVLIKPSHYDDDGYVIQWFRSAIPSNTLAVLNGLALDCKDRRVLGDDVEIVVSAFDETNTRIKPERIARQLSGGRGMVALVGVQSNQFPHAMDLARPLRAAGVPVCLGGFHVSGCLSMLPELPAELKEAMNLGISLFAGEAEGRLELVLRDTWNGTLKPLYNYMADLPRLGESLRPSHRHARAREAEHQVRHPSGHHVPPPSAFHREGGPRRSGARVHRPRKHQSRCLARSQEKAE